MSRTILSPPPPCISSTTSSTAFSLLLSLPTELRLEIYNHLLTYPFTLTHPTSLLPIFRPLYTFTPTPLLLSHQLHTETKPRFYALNTFTITVTPCAPLPYPLPSALAWVTHLVIDFQIETRFRSSSGYARVSGHEVGFGELVVETLMRVKERERLSLSATTSKLTSVRGEMEMEMEKKEQTQTHPQRQRLKRLTLRLPIRYCTPSVSRTLSELVAQESGSGHEDLRLELQLYDFLNDNWGVGRGDAHGRDIEVLLAAVGRGFGVGGLGEFGDRGTGVEGLGDVRKRWQRREHWGGSGREVSAILECGGRGGRRGTNDEGRGKGKGYNIPQKLRVGENKGDEWEGVDGGCVAERKDVDVGFLWE